MNTKNKSTYDVTQRSVGMSIILSLITGGIYYLYWQYQTIKNVNSVTRRKSGALGQFLLYFLVPFYAVYWWYDRSHAFNQEIRRGGYDVSCNEFVAMLCSLLMGPFSVVPAAIMQNAVNELELAEYYCDELNSDDENSVPSEKTTSAAKEKRADPTPRQRSEGEKKLLTVTNAIKLVSAVLVLVIFFGVGNLFWLRPERSEVEKRELKPFPTCPYNLFDPDESMDFVNYFLMGQFTNEISTWYADTFPTRELMVNSDFFLESLYGFGDKISGVQGDDIGGDMVFDPNAPIQSDGEGDKIGGFWLKGDTAYELYAFSDANSKAYAAIINQAADKIGNSADVYDIIVPLAYTFALSDAERDKTGASDCREAIRYMYSGMGDNVNKVNIIPALDAHRNEYLYYRTDHHWTALGAYYAYTAFCESKGIAPTPLESYAKLEFDGFLGTLYADTEQPAAMRNNPDTVEAFVPIGTNEITVTERGGNIREYSVVNEATNSWYPAAGAKYNCFIAGDNPYSEIHNEQKADGSSVVVVKESFGNAFVPFLVDSYEYVYVIDYRYYDGNLVDFVKSNGIDDVVFINNVIATSTSSRLNELKDIIE